MSALLFFEILDPSNIYHKNVINFLLKNIFVKF